MTGSPPAGGADRMQRTLLGLGLMIVGGFFFAGMHGSVRFLSASVHPFEIGFFRQFFAVLLFLPWIARAGKSAWRTQRPGLLVVRSAAQVASLLMWFYALSIVPLAEASSLNFSSTFFVALAAGLILGEAVGMRRWIAVMLGLTGVLIVIRPGFGEVNLGTVLVVAAAVFVAASKIVTKVLSNTDSSPTIVMYTAILMSPMVLIPALFVWQWPTLIQFLWLLAIAAQGTVAHLCLTQAYKIADISAVEPANLVRLIWAALIGFLWFGEVPDGWTIAGALVITGSVAYLAAGEGRASARRRDDMQSRGEPPIVVDGSNRSNEEPASKK